MTFYSLPSDLLGEPSGAYLRLVGNILMAREITEPRLASLTKRSSEGGRVGLPL